MARVGKIGGLCNWYFRQQQHCGGANRLHPGKKVGVQPIKIIKFKDPEEIINCHILFVSFGKSNKMNEVLAKVGSSSTLIIGEKIGILDEGAAINFTIVANKLKFELNKANATKYGLSISASLETWPCSRWLCLARTNIATICCQWLRCGTVVIAWAACRVFFNSETMVIGPTPPGTGVM
ncbi:MAG: YfiR family protein [Bacteroidales bacterium]|nr:YfiR family protein [Bacteroidales bacterium]